MWDEVAGMKGGGSNFRSVSGRKTRAEHWKFKLDPLTTPANIPSSVDVPFSLNPLGVCLLGLF
jgi:hypothetical protein